MGQFIYSIRPDQMSGIEQIHVGPLADRIRRPFNTRSATSGPAGGCILVTAGDAKDCLYKPDEQTWTQSIDGDFWIGIWNDNKPTATDLKRKTQLAGHPVTLADGADYLIPTVRLIEGGSSLPASLILGKNGEVFTTELPNYAELAAAANELFADLCIEMKWNDGEPTMGPGRRMQLAADAMGWNYHIGADELNALGLLTTTNLSDVMAAILDIPSLKKKIVAASGE